MRQFIRSRGFLSLLRLKMKKSPLSSKLQTSMVSPRIFHSCSVENASESSLMAFSQRIKWIRLPFLGNLSYWLASELKKYGYRVGFYPLFTVGRLSSLKNPNPLTDRFGVSCASCGDRDASYVGQTGRKFETKINEHKTKKESALFRHCSVNGHLPDHARFELLHSSVKSRTMSSLEEIETVKSLDDNSLNDMTHTFVNPFIRFYYDIPLPIS